MCIILSGHFIGIFIYLCLTHYDPSYSSISAYATSSKTSEEIKNIFNFSEVTDTLLKGAPKTGIFVEGGLINENLSQSSKGSSTQNLTKNLNRFKHVSEPSTFIEKQNKSYMNLTSNKNDSFFGLSTAKTSLPTKLNETNSNLFLGVPEVIHINGTSSIKPRKGVDNKNEASHSFSGNQSCLWLSESECYGTRELKGLECSCCKEGNFLGKSIKEQTPLNCKNCKSDNILFLESKGSCNNICCNLFVHDIYSVSTTQTIYYNYLNYQTVPSTEKKQQHSFTPQATSDFQKNTTSQVKSSFVSSKKNFKLKPIVTRVPYDVEVVTELLSKDQRKVFIPLVVSLLLLPLIGILIFFLWRRTKEYWDKRYYKRMDFLIDGMYND